MDESSLLAQIAGGEDSTRQFKADIRNAESLASEMAAFANSEGGMLYRSAPPNLDRCDSYSLTEGAHHVQEKKSCPCV